MNNPKVEIKRIDCPEGFAPTFWRVVVDGGNVSDFHTFRRAMNCARKFNPDQSAILLDPIDR